MRRDDLKNILARLRVPAVLALCAVVLTVTVRVPAVGEEIGETLSLFSRIFLVLAVGVAVLQLGDLFLHRNLARLELNVADNLGARRRATRLNILRRVWYIIIVVIIFAAVLTTIPWARQIGISLFASAGIAGLAVGLAAQPVLANLIAGLQIAFTQPIRIDDAVVVEGEWGWIEEIGIFHVVVRLWDWRRLVVPLNFFIERPFQNWTRESASIIGSVFWSLDYRAPLDAMRDKLGEIVKASPLWDQRVCVLQVTEADSNMIQVRALASARSSPEAWDLRCLVREQMITWLQAEYPEALPTLRVNGVPQSCENGTDAGASDQA